MKNKLYRSLVVLIIPCLSKQLISVGDYGSPEAIVVIMRHGQRAPIKTYPTDPYRNMSYWPNGLGNLTEIGIRKQLELGQWLGDHYRNLFGQKYSENNIYTLTNNFTRTIQSARSTLRGIFPNPHNITVKSYEESFNIEIINKRDDNIIKVTKPCPKQKKLLHQLLKSKPFVSEEDEDLFKFLQNMTHMPVNNLEMSFYLHDTLKSERDNDLPLPVWTRIIYPHKLNEKATLYLLSNTYTEELARLQVGPLWSLIMSFFEDVSKSNTSQRVFLISGQEFTIVNILNSMGAFHFQKPEVTSCLIFEMRRTQEDNFYLESFFKNSISLERINFKNCSNQCDFSKVVTLLKPVTVDQNQWNEECYSVDSSKIWIIICVLAGVISLIVLLAYFFFRNVKKFRKTVSSKIYEGKKYLATNTEPTLEMKEAI